MKEVGSRERKKERKSGWLLVTPLVLLILLTPFLVGQRHSAPEGCFKELAGLKPSDARRTKRGTSIKVFAIHGEVDRVWRSIQKQSHRCWGYRFKYVGPGMSLTDSDGIQIMLEKGNGKRLPVFDDASGLEPDHDGNMTSVTVTVPKPLKSVRLLRRFGIYL